MNWKIAHLTFDENTRVLSLNKQKLLLEPKTATVLSYFCKNPNKDITRDELMENLWQGQIVADNTINRVIVLLRKALNDEAKIKKFVATVPKVGYRFIAPVKEISDDEIVIKKRISLKTVMIINLVILCVTAVVISQYLDQPVSDSFNPNVSPMIRLAEGQTHANMAKDGERFIFTSINTGDSDKYDSIFLVNKTGQIPLVISAKGGHANFGLWAHDDSFIIYLYTNNKQCEFHQVDFINGIAQKAQAIYQCDKLWHTEFALSADNNKLYFIENETPYDANRAYELDIKNKNKRLLSQPLVGGIGSFYLDMHPKTGKLLLVSDLQPGRSSFFELNVQENSYTKLKTLNYSVYSAIWSHRTGFIVHPAQHPSYQLIETDLNSDYSRVLVSDSRRISNPKRINPSKTDKRTVGHDYLFTSYLYNRDIVLLDDTEAELNSTVMDYLPAISHDSEQVAFISKRTGYSKIWIKNLIDNQLHSIEPPDKGRTFYHLSWSFDDQIILANTDSGLAWFDAVNLSTINTLSLPLPAYGVGWYSKNELVYSHHENKEWRLYVYNTVTQKTIKQDAQWSFALASPTKQVFFDQQYQVYHQGQKLPQLDQCDNPIQRFRMKHKLDHNDYYCLAKDTHVDLLSWKNMTELNRFENFVDRGEFFSVSNEKKAKTIVANANSDIMRTNF